MSHKSYTLIHLKLRRDVMAVWFYSVQVGSHKSKTLSAPEIWGRFYIMHREPTKIPQSVFRTLSGSFEKHKWFHIWDKQRIFLAPFFPRVSLLRVNWWFKGIFSDFNNIILWDKSTDIKKKQLFPNFQLILIFRLQVMHDYVH